MSNNCDDIPLWLQIITYFGGALLSIGPWIQFYKIIKRKSLRDISIKWMILYFIGLSVNLILPAYLKLYPIVIPASIELCAILLIIIFQFTCYKKYETNTESIDKSIEV